MVKKQVLKMYVQTCMTHGRFLKEEHYMNPLSQLLCMYTCFPGGSAVKNLPAMQEMCFDPWIGKIPWRRKWQPTPVFLPGTSHGQRSLVGYSPWGHKESDITEVTQNWLWYAILRIFIKIIKKNASLFEIRTSYNQYTFFIFQLLSHV